MKEIQMPLCPTQCYIKLLLCAKLLGFQEMVEIVFQNLVTLVQYFPAQMGNKVKHLLRNSNMANDHSGLHKREEVV